mgnify:CR=1 FL=1
MSNIYNIHKYKTNMPTGFPCCIYSTPVWHIPAGRLKKIMLRIDNKQISIFEFMLPEELKKLPDELAMVDSFLF